MRQVSNTERNAELQRRYPMQKKMLYCGEPSIKAFEKEAERLVITVAEESKITVAEKSEIQWLKSQK